MKDLEIEKGVDVPPRQHGAAGRRKMSYPLAQMDIGDSFFIAERDPRNRAKRQSNILATARRSFICGGMHFTTRQEEEGVRVWRIPPPA